MWSFAEKIRQFMRGRYGNDSLNYALFGLYVFLAFVNLFAHRAVILILMLVLIAVILIRAFSRNIYTRIRENDRFLKVWIPVKGWLKLQYNRIRERRTNVYRKCPSCKAVIRLPRRAGKHTVRCPKCNNTFEVIIKEYK